MEELKENKSYKNVEILSEEVQEVMNRIPSAIIRWGMTLMAIIMAGLLIAAAYIPWPQVVECPFEGSLYGTKAVICVTLPPETAKHMSYANGKRSVTLYSSMFSNEFDNGLSGIINEIYFRNNYNDSCTAKMDIELSNKRICNDTIHVFSGNILLTVSNATLFQRILEHNPILK